MTTATHPKTLLVPLLRGELSSEERESTERHVVSCVECRSEAAALRRLLGELREAMPEPPEIDWRRYRAELRTKLEARRGDASPGSAWSRLIPAAAAFALAALVLVVALRSGPPEGTPGEEPGAARLARRGATPRVAPPNVASPQSAVPSEDAADEDLDLLEDFEVIRDLDRVMAAG
jgi:anti-sigma factor RsiW